jgi:hypothetical protein
MPVSRYERLDEKMEKIIAILGEHSTFHATNSLEHEHIVKGMGTLVEQGKVRNGRLEKLEDRADNIESSAKSRWALLVGGGFILCGIMGYFLTKVFEHIAQ